MWMMGRPTMGRSRVEWYSIKASTVAGVTLAALATCLALFADGRHHRATLRCARHAAVHGAEREDNDCVLTENPRGIDRLWEKRHRASFEIQGATLQLEIPSQHGGLETREVNTTSISEIRAHVEEMSVGRQHTSFRHRPDSPHWPGDATAAVLVRDEAGSRHTVHRFDDPQRASDALRALQAYLGTAGGRPVSIALRYDDSAADELVVLMCFLALALFLWRPALEHVKFDTANELVSVQRRNLLGFCLFDFATALENVGQLRVTEHGVEDLHHRRRRSPGTREFGLRMTLAPQRQEPSGGNNLLTARLAPQQHSVRCLDVDLAFGDRFIDPAQLRRIAESANSLLLDSGVKPPIDVEARLCLICESKPPNTVLFPCRHLHVCHRCADKLGDCPICRSPIEERHIVFT